MALREIHRVLRPGGLCAFLDFRKSPRPLAQRAGHAALKLWGGFWGLLLHGHADVYGYIADSLARFPTAPALHAKFDDAGLPAMQCRQCMGGLLEWTICRKMNG